MNNNEKDMPNLGKWADAGEKIGNFVKVAVVLLSAVTFVAGVFAAKVKKST